MRVDVEHRAIARGIEKQSLMGRLMRPELGELKLTNVSRKSRSRATCYSVDAAERSRPVCRGVLFSQLPEPHVAPSAEPLANLSAFGQPIAAHTHAATITPRTPHVITHRRKPQSGCVSLLSLLYVQLHFSLKTYRQSNGFLPIYTTCPLLAHSREYRRQRGIRRRVASLAVPLAGLGERGMGR